MFLIHLFLYAVVYCIYFFEIKGSLKNAILALDRGLEASDVAMNRQIPANVQIDETCYIHIPFLFLLPLVSGLKSFPVASSLALVFSIYPSIHSVCLLLCLSLSACLPFCLCVCLSVFFYLPTRLFDRRSVCFLVGLSVCLLQCLSVCLSVVCQSVFL